MVVEAVVFYRIKSDEILAEAPQYAVANSTTQIDILARIVLRDIIGCMDKAIANTSRPIIKASVKTALDEQTEKWGIEIVRSEIKDLDVLENSSYLWNLPIGYTGKISALPFFTKLFSRNMS